jgi:hypothetical protein
MMWSARGNNLSPFRMIFEGFSQMELILVHFKASEANVEIALRELSKYGGNA